MPELKLVRTVGVLAAGLHFEHRAGPMGAARQGRSKQIAAGVDKQPPSRVGAAGAAGEVRQLDFGATACREFDDRAEVSSRRLRASGRKGRHSHRRSGSGQLSERVQTRGYVGQKSRRRGVAARNLGDFVCRPDAAVCQPPWTVAPRRSPLESMNSWPSGSVPLPVEVGNEAMVSSRAGMSVSLKGFFTEEFRRITTSSAEMQDP